MKTELNLLFTSAGRRVSLLQAFQRALAELPLERHRLVAADLSPLAPALFIADAIELVPRVTDPTYVDAVLDICARHRIDAVVPLLDPELPVLAAAQERFEAAGVRLLLSDSETIDVGTDKRTTAKFFESAGIRTPHVYDIEAVLDDPKAAYPFFMKPADGSSSIGARLIHDRDELLHYKDNTRKPLLQELILGEEYTLDVLCDLGGKVRDVVPRQRLATRAGEVSKGRAVKNDRIIQAGKAVVEALPAPIGCITVQCFLTPDDEVVFIEINPRFGGGYPLSEAAGARYALWLCEMLAGGDPDIPFAGWRDGLTMLRYDDAVFVDGMSDAPIPPRVEPA